MIDLKAIPTSPGCYLMKDKSSKIIYVGKAKHLRKRVRSYFNKSDHSLKTSILVENIVSIDWIATDTEVEALLLENRLIKQHQPRFNIMLKDSKRYAYIAITKDKFPKVISTRKPSKKLELFGPYTDGRARSEIVTLLRKHFKIRTCKTLPKRACLNYYIKTCDAPCIDNISQEDYAKQVDKVRKVLKGDTKELIAELEDCMKDFAKRELFEYAMECRDQLRAIEHIAEKQKVDRIKRYDQDIIGLAHEKGKAVIAVFKISKGVIRKKLEYLFDYEPELLDAFIKAFYRDSPIPQEIVVAEEVDTGLAAFLTDISGHSVRITLPQKGEKKKLLTLVEKNAQLRLGDDSPILRELQEKLNLPSLPLVIEGFDISNTGEADIVASMVQFRGGEPDKSNYRKFVIRDVEGQNDFASMREVVYRRYKRLKEEAAPLPDLILIDGGAIQLDFALRALRELQIKIPIIGLAKQEEEVYLPLLPKPLRWDRRSAALKLLQRVRNEAHRFAVGFERSRRRKQMTVSALDEISGIGDKTKELLLTTFGSVEGIKHAPRDKLVMLVGEKKTQLLKNL